MKIKTIHSVDTMYSADSVEWCPNPLHTSYFVCGTYQLEGDDNTNSISPPYRRKGRIYLYSFDNNSKTLEELHCIETSAILDMKWSPQCPNLPTLATANALGQIEIFELEKGRLYNRACISLNPEIQNLLTLSLDWSWHQGTNNISRHILASDSKGDINLVDYDFKGTLKKIHSWSAHSFEAWICTFDKWERNVVYSGGDDTLMQAFDVRTYNCILTNKSHIAGVTSLLSHPKKDNLLLTGSYDEKMRVFDTRTLKQPISTLDLGGGIWRLKSNHLDKNLILAACMYTNFSLIRLPSNDNAKVKIVGVYNEHDSICYGADWCLHTTDSSEMYMATCSFYDHKLCISSISDSALS